MVSAPWQVLPLPLPWAAAAAAAGPGSAIRKALLLLTSSQAEARVVVAREANCSSSSWGYVVECQAAFSSGSWLARRTPFAAAQAAGGICGASQATYIGVASA